MPFLLLVRRRLCSSLLAVTLVTAVVGVTPRLVRLTGAPPVTPVATGPFRDTPPPDGLGRTLDGVAPPTVHVAPALLAPLVGVAPPIGETDVPSRPDAAATTPVLGVVGAVVAAAAGPVPAPRPDGRLLIGVGVAALAAVGPFRVRPFHAARARAPVPPFARHGTGGRPLQAKVVVAVEVVLEVARGVLPPDGGRLATLANGGRTPALAPAMNGLPGRVLAVPITALRRPPVAAMVGAERPAARTLPSPSSDVVGRAAPEGAPTGAPVVDGVDAGVGHGDVALAVAPPFRGRPDIL